MKKQIIYVGLLCAISATAQNDIDAMRYSQLTFGGTARFASMAGSMGALGGDISSLSFNPAGIGIYRKTELSITPSIFGQRTSSTYNDVNASDGKLNFNLGNIGLVATFKMKEENTSGWKSLNFGLGYNKTNNFNNRIDIQGYNKKSSLLDTYINDANNGNFDEFSTNLAYKCWLINPILGDSTHYNHVIKNYGEYQQKTVTSSGGMGETDLSFGGNYKDKLFIGASIGFVNAKYIEDAVYKETDEKDSIKDFKSFTYEQNLTSKGNGINFKVGVIVKPTDWFRLGIAVHTPTAISFHDDYSSSMKSDLENGNTYDNSSPQGSFDYTVTTPFRTIGSLGFVINKIGLLNVEYEYVDYSTASLSSSPNVFSDVNKTIENKYTATGNLRIGGEVRLDPIAFRLGYALYGSPFAKNENNTASRTSYTAGVGFRQNNYNIDFAYVLTKYSQSNYLYDPSIVNASKSDYSASCFLLTFAVRF